jgi:hypothetical protein
MPAQVLLHHDRGLAGARRVRPPALRPGVPRRAGALRSLRADGYPHRESLEEVVSTALYRTWEYDEEGLNGKPWSPDHNLKTRPNLIRSIVWYLDTFGEADPAQTVILESGAPAVELSFRFQFTQDFMLCGHLDRLVTFQGEHYVMDHKTTTSTLTPRFFEGFNPDNQMSLYTFAGQVIYNLPVKGVLITGVQVAVGFSRYERGFTYRTPEQIKEWHHDTLYHLSAAERYANSEYWPMNDKSCNNYGGCPFRTICSKDPGVRDRFLESNFVRMESAGAPLMMSGILWSPADALPHRAPIQPIHQAPPNRRLRHRKDWLAGVAGPRGYKLRILDFDNGLDPLKKQIQRADPAKLANVEFITLRDKVKASPAGPVLDGGAKAFVASLKLLDNWSEFGKPAEFGPDVILVLDSMTFWANAAYDWADSMNPGAKDKRNIYYAAQQAIESSLGLLSSESFRTNVIVISHVRWVDRPDGTTKGYPSAIGGALSPQIPAYFNSVALATSSGTGDKVKRTIQTAPTALIDLKNPAPFAMQASLPIETGLATFFKTVRS